MVAFEWLLMSFKCFYDCFFLTFEILYMLSWKIIYHKSVTSVGNLKIIYIIVKLLSERHYKLYIYYDTLFMTWLIVYSSFDQFYYYVIQTWNKFE